MKNKFDLLYENILKECSANKKIISESAARIPMVVRDALAQFVSDYLWTDLGICDWPEDEPFYRYDHLKGCHRLWNSDPYYSNHYSDPLFVYEGIADGFVKYDKKSNTVTMDIDQWDLLELILECEDYTSKELIESLNQNYNKINDINFVWIGDVEG